MCKENKLLPLLKRWKLVSLVVFLLVLLTLGVWIASQQPRRAAMNELAKVGLYHGVDETFDLHPEDEDNFLPSSYKHGVIYSLLKHWLGENSFYNNAAHLFSVRKVEFIDVSPTGHNLQLLVNHFPEVEYINFSSLREERAARITEEGWKSLTQLHGLHKVSASIDESGSSKEILEWLGKLESLETLELYPDPGADITNEDLQPLLSLKTLKHLKLADMEFNGTLFRNQWACTDSLRSLNLHLKGEESKALWIGDFYNLGQFKNLESLTLRCS